MENTTMEGNNYAKAHYTNFNIGNINSSSFFFANSPYVRTPCTQFEGIKKYHHYF